MMRIPFIDHVTVQVPYDQLDTAEDLLLLLGLRRVEVDSVYAARNAEWNYRHYEDETKFRVHVVEPPPDEGPDAFTPEPAFGHFRCIVTEAVFAQVKGSKWVERDSGSGRIWLRGPGQLRVECITHEGLTPKQKQQAQGRMASIGAIAGGVTADVKPQHLVEHAQILNQAMTTFDGRDAKYSDSWKRYGWRGALFNLRRKSERAWHLLFNASPQPQIGGKTPDDGLFRLDEDDLIDIINYAAMTIALMRESNRDGVPEWWEVQG